ncbi:MAG: NADH-quinone oxidoreductase subunit H [Euryarchaeota archaeon]|nr:NADH-quinone oxidoreductase subunit H [Euryarchaeota archaeon]
MDIVYIIAYTILVILIVVPLYSLLIQGIDRKIVARMQNRVGPPIIQPFYDFLKLIGKEQIIPTTARRVFLWAPMLCVSVALLGFMYVPFGTRAPLSTRGDIIFIMYLILMFSAFYVLGPMASGSPFALVGAQRKLISVTSIEVPFLMTIGALSWLAYRLNIGKPFSLEALSTLSTLIWTQYYYLIPLWFIAFLIATIWLAGEAGKGFFDVAEAETELGGGVEVEYSGVSLAFYKFAHVVMTILGASIITAIFIPWRPSLAMSTEGIIASVLDVLWHMFIVFVLLLFAYTIIRAASGRFKIDQFAMFYWGRVLPLTVAFVISLYVAIAIIW